MDMLEIWAIG